MEKHTRTAKVNIPMCMAGVLFCLTLISVHLTSGLYAKYTTSAGMADKARVITFGDITLTESGDFEDDGKGMVIPGVDLMKKAVVDFTGSEAATYVFVEVTPSGWNIADDNKTFSITMDNNTIDGKIAMQWSIANDWRFLLSDNGIHIYYCELAPNTALVGADIIAEGGKITVSETITKNEIINMKNISIKLRATVVQSGGFESPEAAWNSVAAKEG